MLTLHYCPSFSPPLFASCSGLEVELGILVFARPALLAKNSASISQVGLS